MNDERFRQLVKKTLLERNWSNLASQWTRFVPLIDPAGSEPEFPTSGFLGFQTVARKMVSSDTSVALELVDGLREVMFREAVFLMHKASHAIGCAEVSVRSGAKTWSLSGAYQGALFGAKSIVYLLGVGLPEYNSKLVITDVWPKIERRKGSKQRLELDADAESPVQFTLAPIRLEHRHLWILFQRLLNVCKVEIWQKEYVSALRKLEIREFALQRNIVHNRDWRWILDDLHEFKIDEQFGVYEVDLHNALVYAERSDFSIALALAIMRMALELVKSLTAVTNKLNAEITLLENRLTMEYHPLYIASGL